MEATQAFEANRSIKELLEKILGEKNFIDDQYAIFNPEDFPEASNVELMVRRLVYKAICGNDKSLTEVLDRILGKPKQTTKNEVEIHNYTHFLDQVAIDERNFMLDAETVPSKTIDDDDGFMQELGLA